MIIALYVQMQAATAAAATTKAALQEEKVALESRLQDNSAACAALEAKVELLYNGPLAFPKPVEILSLSLCLDEYSIILERE